jgi:hypothetical protein
MEDYVLLPLLPTNVETLKLNIPENTLARDGILSRYLSQVVMAPGRVKRWRSS